MKAKLKKSKADLEQATETFFSLHWIGEIMGNIPNWCEWNFLGSVPNGNLKGCYALVEENEIVYIGVGLGKSKGIDEGSGLGARVSKYWEVDRENSNKEERKYKSKIENVTKILTIGFPEEYSYLASALEVFLIQELKPKKNTNLK